MVEHAPLTVLVVLLVVVTVEGGESWLPQALAANDVGFSRTGSFHLERNLHDGSEKENEEEREELDFKVLNVHEGDDDDEEEEEEEEEEENDECDEEEEEEPEERDPNVMNMIESRPEIVTMNPELVRTNPDDSASTTDDQRRRRRPHKTRNDRKRRRRRRRKWKNASRKYYRGNRTYKFGTTKKQHKGSGGSRAGQRLWSSPNKRSGWVAGQPYRSLDPRRVKVRRHLMGQHNLLRSNVDPPAADMLAVRWYKTAAEQAQAWAEQCGHDSHLEHPSVRWTSSYGACGQNVFVSPTKKRWSHVLEHWWGAKKHFHYGASSNNGSLVAAYTQMVWYNSHQLGCGFSQCYTTGGSTFFRYVCNYCPAGNDPSRLARPYSEGLSCSLCPGACRSLCPRRRCPLCTNSCTYSDLWVNCGALDQQWHEWLCNTKTPQGVERFKNCRATCQCVNEIT